MHNLILTVIISLLCSSAASAHNGGRTQPDPVPSYVAASAVSNPAILIAVRVQYSCGDDFWTASSTGMELRCGEVSVNIPVILVTWEGEIFRVTRGWKSEVKKIGNIKDLHIGK